MQTPSRTSSLLSAMASIGSPIAPRPVYASPAPQLRPGRLRRLFGISGRQWRMHEHQIKLRNNAQRNRNHSLEVPVPPERSIRMVLSELWRNIQNRVVAPDAIAILKPAGPAAVDVVRTMRRYRYHPNRKPRDRR